MAQMAFSLEEAPRRSTGLLHSFEKNLKFSFNSLTKVEDFVK